MIHTLILTSTNQISLNILTFTQNIGLLTGDATVFVQRTMSKGLGFGGSFHGALVMAFFYNFQQFETTQLKAKTDMGNLLVAGDPALQLKILLPQSLLLLLVSLLLLLLPLPELPHCLSPSLLLCKVLCSLLLPFHHPLHQQLQWTD